MKKLITNIVKRYLDDVFLVFGAICIISAAFTLSVALGLFVLGVFFMAISYLVSR